MAHDPDEDETARLRRVYGDYAADDAVRQRWDPEQPGNRRILAERDALLGQAVADICSTRPPGPLTVVDLGCGEGQVLGSLLDSAPMIGPVSGAAAVGPAIGIGVDLLEGRLHRARAQHPTMPLLAANGAAIPLTDASVAVMVVFTVFSSILDPQVSRAVAGEITRVVEPGGAVIWYDLRRDNPRNPEVHGLSATAVGRLFPGWSPSLRSCTVLPPLARKVGTSTRAYDLLARVSVLRSHLFGVLRAPVEASG